MLMADAPRFEVPPAIPIERRRSRRIQVSLQVVVEIGGNSSGGRLTELSRAGARIELRGRWTVGESLIVRRNGVELHAQIVWSDGSTAGLLFPEPMVEVSFSKLREQPSITGPHV
jgi:hypothetical protein